MHITKVLRLGCVAGLALAATTARADYTIGINSSPAQTTTVGGSGQSSFQVTFSQTASGSTTWTYAGSSLSSVNVGTYPPVTVGGVFSSLTIDSASTLKLASGQTYQSGHTYNLIVDWTVANNATPGDYGIYLNLGANKPNSGGIAGSGMTDLVSVHPVSVPEASQVAASAFLLVGGVVVYAGRRSMRKKVG
jgi:hypothetical protein